MSFGGLGYIAPPGIIAGPVNSVVFKFDRVLSEPLAFAKRFPVWLQQYAAFQPEGKITSKFPDGWRHPEWAYGFAKRFPVTALPYATTGLGLGF